MAVGYISYIIAVAEGHSYVAATRYVGPSIDCHVYDIVDWRSKGIVVAEEHAFGKLDGEASQSTFEEHNKGNKTRKRAPSQKSHWVIITLYYISNISAAQV